VAAQQPLAQACLKLRVDLTAAGTHIGAQQTPGVGVCARLIVV
jgi:hypothetical protein